VTTSGVTKIIVKFIGIIPSVTAQEHPATADVLCCGWHGTL